MDKSYGLKTGDIEHTYVTASNIVWRKAQESWVNFYAELRTQATCCLVLWNAI